MTFSQYFDYHSSLKPKWKNHYVSYKELRKQVNTLKQLIHDFRHHHHHHHHHADSPTTTIDYVRMLSMIKSLHITINDNDTTTPTTTTTNNNNNANHQEEDDIEIQQCAQTFFDMLYSDVQSALQFYNENIIENEQMLKQLEQRAREENWQVRRELKSRSRKNLQTEMVSLYRRLEFLYSFLHVNRLAISHIVRKFTDCIPESEIESYLPSPTPSLLLSQQQQQQEQQQQEQPTEEQETSLFVISSTSNHENDAPVSTRFYNLLYDEFCSPPRFCDSSLVKELMESTENLYALVFTTNDHQAAMSQLREPHDKHSHGDTAKLAFTVGVIVPILVMIIVTWLKSPATTSIKGFYAAFPVFRGTLLYILYTWLWGVNLYIFRRRRINHVFIFEFDPTTSLNHIRMFKTASVLTIIWVFYFFLYLGAAKGSINLIPVDAKYYPLALALTLILIVIFPFHAFHLRARLTLLKVMGNLLLTPFGRADFRECFVADILTSMVIPITDTMYMFCFFFSNTWFNNPYDNNNKCHKINRFAGPCLTFLPYAWRLGQCLKKYYETRVTSHLLNGLKYVSAMTVIVLNTLHVNLEEERGWGPIRWVWLAAVVFSTLFSFSWDIQMDWGLLAFGKSEKVKSKKSKDKSREDVPIVRMSETSRLLPRLSVEHSIRPVHLTKKDLRSTWKHKYKPRLRDRRFFANYVYLIASLFNFVARFAWAGTISTFFEERKDFLKIIFGSIELTRRCSWSVFRLEWAVVSNSEGYRKHATVPLPMGK